MMNNLDNWFHTPPAPLEIENGIPLVFLAGPVQGAPDWQHPLASSIFSRTPRAHIASPRRTVVDQLSFDADEQVAWEHAALERARKFGVLAFWWAAQNLDDATYPSGRAYAQTTRIELGKALGWRSCEPELPVVIGYDPLYTDYGGGSENYIRREAEHAHIPVHSTLKDFTNAIERHLIELS